MTDDPPGTLPRRYYNYRIRVQAYMQEHPAQRTGQAYYNVLYEFDPEAAQQIHGTPLDPFLGGYETLSEFKAWLRARWGDI